LLVAHNAGDQESTARRALNHDAAGVEIDVRLVDGVLYATHSAPSGLMPMRAWQAPRLRDAWLYSANAKVLKLDLKSTSQPALDALVRFVDARPSDRQVLIVSSNPDALAYLDGALPESLGLLSLSSGAEVDALLEHKGRADGVDGISIPGWALTARRIQALKEHGYVIDAWTVNDIERLVDLAALGVDIITTDNLAFFDMALDTPKEETAGL
jgi:glycerophosphoryl diester phosphodiesterase